MHTGPGRTLFYNNASLSIIYMRKLSLSLYLKHFFYWQCCIYVAEVHREKDSRRLPLWHYRMMLNLSVLIIMYGRNFNFKKSQSCNCVCTYPHHCVCYSSICKSNEFMKFFREKKQGNLKKKNFYKNYEAGNSKWQLLRFIYYKKPIILNTIMVVNTASR